MCHYKELLDPPNQGRIPSKEYLFNDIIVMGYGSTLGTPIIRWCVHKPKRSHRASILTHPHIPLGLDVVSFSVYHVNFHTST